MIVKLPDDIPFLGRTISEKEAMDIVVKKINAVVEGVNSIKKKVDELYHYKLTKIDGTE